MECKWTVTATFLVALVSGGCQRPYQISRADTERVVTVLASDRMEGRAAFGPTIREAADFIASEFRAAGLEPVPGNEEYLQVFTVHTIDPAEVEVVLDGSVIPQDRYAIALRAPQADWIPGDGQPVLRVGADQSPDRILAALRGAEGQALALVHESHEPLFRRLQSRLAEPGVQLDSLAGPSVAFVLTPDVDVRRYSVRASGVSVARDLFNVVGMLPGRRSDEIVLFSAHYDHVGILPSVDGDSIANGANDDASGTTAIIELARYFAARAPQERSLMFAAFTAEELGGIGSAYFSRHIDPDQIVAMLNIEMIGKPATDRPNAAWVTGWDRSDLGRILARGVQGTRYTFYADPYPAENLFYRSDNASLARLGVPAHSMSTTPIDVDTDYHQVTDEVETLDLDHMTGTIRAIAAGAGPIVAGEETPTRLDTGGLD